MVREADQYASADKERRAAIEAKNEAETLIYSAEKNVNEYKDKVCLPADWRLRRAFASCGQARACMCMRVLTRGGEGEHASRQSRLRGWV